jgi:hypothetical protein
MKKTINFITKLLILLSVLHLTACKTTPKTVPENPFLNYSCKKLKQKNNDLARVLEADEKVRGKVFAIQVTSILLTAAISDGQYVSAPSTSSGYELHMQTVYDDVKYVKKAAAAKKCVLNKPRPKP